MSSSAAETHVPRPAAWEVPPRGPLEEAHARRAADYVLLRASGVVLSVLVLGHFAVTHVVTDVAHDNSAFVARRLSSAVWVTWDSTMLAAALAHGAIGVRLAVSDYASGRRRLVLCRTVDAIALLLFGLGAIAIARAAHA